jgi:hypothetical protein
MCYVTSQQLHYLTSLGPQLEVQYPEAIRANYLLLHPNYRHEA